MGQGGKSGKSGKSGKGGKDPKSGKSGKDPKSGKDSKSGKGDKGKDAKRDDKNEKKGGNKQSSLSSIVACICLLSVYSIVVGYLGGQVVKTVGDNPELIKMASMASDSRLKKNIKPMQYGLKELTQIQPQSYNYINEHNNTTRHIGVMAQDLQKVMPELVVEVDSKATEFKDYISEKNVYGVKYQELVPVLINAIKELKEEIDTLKQRI
jgi:hypothetical protein